MGYKEIEIKEKVIEPEEPPECKDCIGLNVKHSIMYCYWIWLGGYDYVYRCSNCNNSFRKENYYSDKEWIPE